MMQPLPIGGFEWVPHNDMQSIVDKLHLPEDHPDHIKDDAKVGYILEVDLAYPSCIHQRHNDLPLAPQKVKILRSMLSEYCGSFDNNDFVSTEKLVPNLFDKTKYVLHYRNLKLYLELGMVLTKTHQILQFRQEKWMASYIDLNTELRKEAKSEFEKNFCKLANNAVYGLSWLLLF
jgi:hypothetical protein